MFTNTDDVVFTGGGGDRLTLLLILMTLLMITARFVFWRISKFKYVTITDFLTHAEDQDRIMTRHGDAESEGPCKKGDPNE